MSDEWDATWTRICEMEMGSGDPFPEFAETVTQAMEHTGNRVGRPLVMKVQISVSEGELDRPVDTEGADGSDRDDVEERCSPDPPEDQ